jgi:arylsulfatase A-like enzyme
MPTFSDLIGLNPLKKTDGISFLPTLFSKKQSIHEYLNWEFQLSGWFQELPNGGFRQSVRINKWKAVRYNLNNIELYDLENDISELNNIAHLHPQIISQAEKIFKKSRSKTVGFPYGGVIQNYKSMDRFNFN